MFTEVLTLFWLFLFFKGCICHLHCVMFFPSFWWQDSSSAFASRTTSILATYVLFITVVMLSPSELTSSVYLYIRVWGIPFNFSLCPFLDLPHYIFYSRVDRRMWWSILLFLTILDITVGFFLTHFNLSDVFIFVRQEPFSNSLSVTWKFLVMAHRVKLVQFRYFPDYWRLCRGHWIFG